MKDVLESKNRSAVNRFGGVFFTEYGTFKSQELRNEK